MSGLDDQIHALQEARKSGALTGADAAAIGKVGLGAAAGTSKRVDHRERPTLLTSADGRPQWLVTGVEVGSKASSFPNCFSETVVTEILA